MQPFFHPAVLAVHERTSLKSISNSSNAPEKSISAPTSTVRLNCIDTLSGKVENLKLTDVKVEAWSQNQGANAFAKTLSGATVSKVALKNILVAGHRTAHGEGPREAGREDTGYVPQQPGHYRPAAGHGAGARGGHGTEGTHIYTFWQ